MCTIVACVYIGLFVKFKIVMQNEQINTFFYTFHESRLKTVGKL